jgi:hypothetical protein
VNCRECRDKILLECGKGAGRRSLARDQHIVAARARVCRRDEPHSLLEPAADAIADDGIAELLGGGEAEARGLLLGWYRAGCDGPVVGRPVLRDCLGLHLGPHGSNAPGMCPHLDYEGRG